MRGGEGDMLAARPKLADRSRTQPKGGVGLHRNEIRVGCRGRRRGDDVDRSLAAARGIL